MKYLMHGIAVCGMLLAVGCGTESSKPSSASSIPRRAVLGKQADYGHAEYESQYKSGRSGRSQSDRSFFFDESGRHDHYHSAGCSAADDNSVDNPFHNNTG